MKLSKICLCLFLICLLAGCSRQSADDTVPENNLPDTDVESVEEIPRDETETGDLSNGITIKDETFVWVLDREVDFNRQKMERIQQVATEEYGYLIPVVCSGVFDIYAVTDYNKQNAKDGRQKGTWKC